MTDRLDDLLAAVRDGSASERDYAELSELIAADPAARKRYLVQVAVWSELSVGLIAPAGAEKGDGNQGTRSETAPSHIAHRPSNILLPLAAALLLSAAAVAIYIFVINPQSEIRDPKSQPPIATLIESTGTFVVNDDVANPGSEFAAGDYSIESGTAELLLRSRVGVQLRGRSRITVTSPMQASLSHGGAAFYCPPGTEGYTLHLPGGARVVDLGTRFVSTVVSGRRSVTRVLEGAVEVYSADGSRFTVDAGYAATVDNGVLVSVHEPGLLVNGDFNAARDDAWVLTGHTGRDRRPERAAEGAGFLNFNTGQKKPDGVAAQSFATEPGRDYEITLVTATFGGRGKARLGVRVHDDQGRVLLERDVDSSEPASSDLADAYRPRAFRFTAAGEQATLSLHDKSPNEGSGFDLYVDNVRIMPVAPTRPDPDDESISTDPDIEKTHPIGDPR